MPMPLLGGKALLLIARTAGTNIGSMPNAGGLASAFDGVTSQLDAASAQSAASQTSAYVGKTLAGPKVFGKAIVYGPSDKGFSGTDPVVTLDIYGKTGAVPANSSDGTLLGTLTFTDTANESGGRIVTSTDMVSAWDHLWVRVSAAAATTFRVSELELHEWA